MMDMMNMLRIKIVNKSKYETPKYKTDGSAGMDIRLNIDSPVKLAKHSISDILPTGLYMQVPAGFEVELRPRSGLACKHGVTLANSPATIDSDYRGEIGICLVNNSNEDYILQPGERVCQMLVHPVTQLSIDEVEELDDTARGAGGFGSTGKN